MPYQGLNILAVNGDAELEECLRAAAQGDDSWSLATKRVATAGDLVAQVRDGAPDLLILDARDGRITPRALAAALEAEAIPAFPILVVAREAQADGPYEVVESQEFQPRLLRRIIENALERARLVGELRMIESHFREVADAAHLLVWASDETMARVFVNQGWLAFTGRTLEDELGFGWLDGLHPDDRERCLRVYRDTFAARKPFKVEYRLHHRDGTYHWVLDQGHPRFGSAGQFLGFSGSCIDVDEYVQLEKALRASDKAMRRHLAHLQAIYDSAPVGLAFTDLEHRYTSVNERLAALTGRSVDELLGRRVDEVVTPPFGANAVAMREQVLQTGAPLLNVELRGLSEDAPEGRRTWLGNYYPVYDAEGSPLGVNVVVMEITERKRQEERLEAEVRARTAQARQLATDLTLAEQRERRRIARVLHDDIQQKLYALQVHIHLLGQYSALHERPDTEMRMQLIGRLIDELIDDNSRLSVELSPPTISHEGLVDALGWLRQYIALQHGLAVHMEITGDLVIQDADLREVIFQMVRELLLNVAKHAGVDRAELYLRRVGERLVVRVVDQGAGFDPAAVLEQADDYTAFGLRTLRERVDIFGGSLDVDSRPGKGASITLVMPMGVSGG